MRWVLVGDEIIQSMGILTKIALSNDPSPKVLNGTSVSVA